MYKHIKKINVDIGRVLIIATKNGLYILENNHLYKILNGEYYGITLYGNNTYIFEKINNKGRIIAFKKSICVKQKYEIFIDDISPGCHQIDFIDNYLFITDTYNNRLLKYNLDGDKINEYYPLGKLSNSRESHNYSHINSIYGFRESIYILCHNESKKTGKKSEIIKLNNKMKVIKKIKIDALSAHNCVIYDDKILVCDSLNKRLIYDNIEVLKCNLFTRGLSVFNDLIFVGGSEYANRDKREFAKGAIFVLDNNFNLIDKVKMPAMVQEIRGTNHEDYSFSNTTNNSEYKQI